MPLGAEWSAARQDSRYSESAETAENRLLVIVESRSLCVDNDDLSRCMRRN